MRHLHGALAGLVYTIVLAGCEPGSRDLVPVAEERAPISSRTLQEHPELSAPGFAFGGDSVFFGGPPMGVMSLDGRIVVTASQDDQRIIVLNSLGEPIVMLGGTGQGPGEFRSMRLLNAQENGSFAVWDRLNARVTVYDDQFRASVLPLPLLRSQTVVGVLNDSLIVTTPLPDLSGALAELFPQDRILPESPRPYYLHNLEGMRIGAVEGGLEPHAALLELEPENASSPSLQIPVSTWGCLPVTWHLISGRDILIADSERGILNTLDAAGSFGSIYTSSHRDTVQAELVELIEQQMTSYERQYGALTERSKSAARARIGEIGDLLPAVWSAMIPDVGHGVWLQRAACYASIQALPTTTWEIVSHQGELTGLAVLPSDLTPLAVHGERILVSRVDELGIQFVEVYRLTESSRE